MKLLNFILFIMSYSPVLCLSDDNNFGSNENGIEQFRKRMRISLFSFNFGAYKYYFISIKKGEQIKFVHKLDLNTYDEFSVEDNERVKVKQEVYLNENFDDSILVDKEFIGYLFQNENDRKNISYNKINTYTTIILAIIPLILLFFKPETFTEASLVIKVLIIILLYMLINISAFILQSNKVNGYYRSRYVDLKGSDNKEKEIIKLYYLDWQNLRHESNRLVAFVRNIEKYIKGAIIVALAIVVLNFQENSNKYYSYNNSANSIVQVDISKLEIKDQRTVKIINKINERIPDEDVIKVVITYNNENILDNKSFKAIYNYFNIYKNENDIVLLKETSDIKNNEIKIIILEE